MLKVGSEETCDTLALLGRDGLENTVLSRHPVFSLPPTFSALTLSFETPPIAPNWAICFLPFDLNFLDSTDASCVILMPTSLCYNKHLGGLSNIYLKLHSLAAIPKGKLSEKC